MFTFRDSLEDWREANPGCSDRIWRETARAYHEVLRPRFEPLVERSPGTWSRPEPERGHK